MPNVMPKVPGVDFVGGNKQTAETDPVWESDKSLYLLIVNAFTQTAADALYLKLTGGTITPASDSTTTVKVTRSNGTSNVFSVDTTNTRVGIGTAAPTQSLDVAGQIRATSVIRATSGIVNDDSSTNSRVQPTANGTVIDRNVTDANPVLQVQQLKSDATGALLKLTNTLGDKVIFDKDGALSVPSVTEGGTALSSKYLGIAATAADTSKIDGDTVTTTTPSTDQVLKYNGSAWVNGAETTVNGGSGVDFFYDDNVSDIGGYATLNKAPDSAAEQDETAVCNNNKVLIEEYASASGGLGGTQIDAGVWTFDIWAYASLLTLASQVVIDIYKRTSGGTETLLFSVNSGTITTTSLATIDLYSITSVQQAFSINATDRLVAKVSGQTSNITSTTVHFVHGGTTHYSHFNTPLVIRHDDLAGLNAGDYQHLTATNATDLTDGGDTTLHVHNIYPLKTATKVICIQIENPTATDVIPFFQPKNNIANSKVIASTVGAGSTIDFNIERRAAATLGTAGTNILTADLQADDNSANTTTFDNSGAVTAGEYMVLCASAKGGTPTNLMVTVEFNE